MAVNDGHREDFFEDGLRVTVSAILESDEGRHGVDMRRCLLLVRRLVEELELGGWG